MARNDMTIEVTAKVTVSDEMARRCLRLLEIWQADNVDKYIEGKEILTEDGRKIVYRIKER